MAYRIRETCLDGGVVERHLEVSILVLPGETIPRPNRPRQRPGEFVREEAPGLTLAKLEHAKLEHAASIIRRQSDAWSTFALQVEHRRAIYRFSFRVEATREERFVRNAPPVAQGAQVADDGERLRGYRDVMSEARMFDNIAVVHPSFSDDPHARLVDRNGELLPVALHGHLLDRAAISCACRTTC